MAENTRGPGDWCAQCKRFIVQNQATADNAGGWYCEWCGATTRWVPHDETAELQEGKTLEPADTWTCPRCAYDSPAEWIVCHHCGTFKPAREWPAPGFYWIITNDHEFPLDIAEIKSDGMVVIMGWEQEYTPKKFCDNWDVLAPCTPPEGIEP